MHNLFFFNLFYLNPSFKVQCPILPLLLHGNFYHDQRGAGSVSVISLFTLFQLAFAWTYIVASDLQGCCFHLGKKWLLSSSIAFANADPGPDPAPTRTCAYSQVCAQGMEKK